MRSGPADSFVFSWKRCRERTRPFEQFGSVAELVRHVWTSASPESTRGSGNCSSSPTARAQASGLCRANRIEPSRLYCAFEIMHHVRLADGLGQPSPRASRCSGGQVTSSARLRNRSVFGQRSSTDAPPWAAAMSDPYRCSAKIVRRRAFGVLPVLVVDERGRVLMREWPDTNSVLHCEIT